MKTASGQYITFHRDACPFAKPGAKIPPDYTEFADKPWFFTREDGNPTALGSLRGYPMIYSPAFATEEEALAAAEAWELEKPHLDQANAFSQAQLNALYDEVSLTNPHS